MLKAGNSVFDRSAPQPSGQVTATTFQVGADAAGQVTLVQQGDYLHVYVGGGAATPGVEGSVRETDASNLDGTGGSANLGPAQLNIDIVRNADGSFGVRDGGVGVSSSFDVGASVTHSVYLGAINTSSFNNGMQQLELNILNIPTGVNPFSPSYEVDPFTDEIAPTDRLWDPGG